MGKKDATYAAKFFAANPALKEAAQTALKSKGFASVREMGPQASDTKAPYESDPSSTGAQVVSAASYRSVNIDGEELYRVEGDMLLDEDQLAFYLLQKSVETALPLSVPSAGLIGITEGGTWVRWKPGMVLTYTVLRNTFVISGEDGYRLTVDCMKQATSDWEKTCGVKFQHLSNLDSSATTSPAGVIFPVREFNANGEFIAAAFFPNDPTHRRRVLIDPSFFGLTPPPSGFSQVGVLRHELGHTLGFRHEHIRSGAPPACPDEPTFDTENLTAYDPQSVMHYFCGGVGSRLLAITDLDRTGAQKLYGPPLGAVRFVG
jgi:hypothetical protein